MSELYLLRHAKAAPQVDGLRDMDRPLEERGREGAKAIAGWLKRQHIVPELILCSATVRTRQTLAEIVDAFDPAPEIAFEAAIYLASPERLIDLIRDIPDEIERAMIIGHNPGIHELALRLSDTTTGPLADKLMASLPTAGLVRLELNTDWDGARRRCARLVGMVSPKELMGRD